ncbi:MAG: YdcH family protein [Novosphingobium sp.]
MSHTPHQLADEFPHDHWLLHELKLRNPHFVTLADRYQAVNGEIHRIEAGVETRSDSYVEDLKKQRLALIDEISQIIAKARAPA